MIDELMRAQIQLGDEADSFFKSDLGKYVLGVAEQELQEALMGLRHVDPHDVAKIIALQNKAAVAEAVPAWLNGLIVESRQTQEMLEAYEEE